MRSRRRHKTTIFFGAGLFLAIYSLLVSLAHGGGFGRDRFQFDSATPWEITAKRLFYDENSQVYEAEGNVVIKKGEQVLRCSRARYERVSGIAKVWGGFTFQSYGDVLSGEEGVFNLKAETGKVTAGHLFLKETHFHITGSLMERLSPNTYLVRDGTITTCDSCPPDWSITFSELRVTVEGYGKAKHTAFRIKNLPVLYVPYLIFPAKTKRQSGLLPPRIGYSDRNGLDLEIPFFWAISRDADATLYQRILTERGYMQGLEFRYAAPRDSGGDFLFDILSDKKGEKDLNDPDQLDISPFSRTNKTRYWFRARVDQAFGWALRLHGDFDYVSDPDYLREFEGSLFGYEARPDLEKEWERPFEERYSPFRTSRVKLTRYHPLHYGEIYSSYYQNQRDDDSFIDSSGGDQTPQPLLGLGYALPPFGLKAPVYVSLDSGYRAIWRDVGQKGHEASLTSALRVPLSVGRHVRLEPSVSYTRYLRFTESYGGTESDTSQGAYQFDIKLFSKLERIFNMEEKGSLSGLKHTIWPILSYQYRGIHPQEESDPWFNQMTAHPESHRLVFTLENYLDMRIESGTGLPTYQQLIALKLVQGYDIREARGRDLEPGEDKEPFDPLEVSLTLRPHGALDLNGNLKWDHYDQEIASTQISADLNLERSGGRKDHFALEYSYQNEEEEYLNATARLNLWWGISIGTSISRDLIQSRYTRKTHWVDYQSQCWGMRVAVEEEDQDRRIMVFVRFSGLGEVKVW